MSKKEFNYNFSTQNEVPHLMKQMRAKVSEKTSRISHSNSTTNSRILKDSIRHAKDALNNNLIQRGQQMILVTNEAIREGLEEFNFSSNVPKLFSCDFNILCQKLHQFMDDWLGKTNKSTGIKDTGKKAASDHACQRLASRYGNDLYPKLLKRIGLYIKSIVEWVVSQNPSVKPARDNIEKYFNYKVLETLARETYQPDTTQSSKKQLILKRAINSFKPFLKERYGIQFSKGCKPETSDLINAAEQYKDYFRDQLSQQMKTIFGDFECRTPPPVLSSPPVHHQTMLIYQLQNRLSHLEEKFQRKIAHLEQENRQLRNELNLFREQNMKLQSNWGMSFENESPLSSFQGDSSCFLSVVESDIPRDFSRCDIPPIIHDLSTTSNTTSTTTPAIDEESFIFDNNLPNIESNSVMFCEPARMMMDPSHQVSDMSTTTTLLSSPDVGFFPPNEFLDSHNNLFPSSSFL